MQAEPAFANQARLVIVRAFEGRLFFLPTPENKQLLAFLLAVYALRYSIDLNLVVMMGDKVVLHFLDHEGRGSQFIQTTFAMYVRCVNGDSRSGSMVQPGSSKGATVLDAESELQALLQSALLPTEHITPNARLWPGLLFGPEQVGKEFEFVRPGMLENSRVFPPSVKMTVAAPKFFAHLTNEAVRRKFRRLLNDRQKDRAKEKKAAGTSYVGPDAALRRVPGSLPPKAERPRPGRRKRTHFLGASATVVEQAMEVLRKFREAYYDCLEALREGKTEITWPAGTNFHHFVNGFPRLTVNPAPIPP